MVHPLLCIISKSYNSYPQQVSYWSFSPFLIQESSYPLFSAGLVISSLLIHSASTAAFLQIILLYSHSIHRLTPVQQYFKAALSSSTHKIHKTVEKKYLSCYNLSLSTFPALENKLCYFAACLGQEGLAYSFIQTYLSGVRQIEIAAGYSD